MYTIQQFLSIFINLSTITTNSRTFSSLPKETTHLIVVTPVPLPLDSGNQYLLFVLMDLYILGILYGWNHIICGPAAGFFHSACFQASSMLSHEFTPFYGYFILWISHFGLSIHQIFHFLGYYKQCCHEDLFSCVFSSIRYISKNKVAESYGNSTFDLLKKYQTVFQSRNAPFYILTSNVYRFSCLCILANICYFLSFFIIAVLKWYATVVLIPISIMTTDFEDLSTCPLTKCKKFY